MSSMAAMRSGPTCLDNFRRILGRHVAERLGGHLIVRRRQQSRPALPASRSSNTAAVIRGAQAE